jgi:hypothetical protein
LLTSESKSLQKIDVSILLHAQGLSLCFFIHF